MRQAIYDTVKTHPVHPTAEYVYGLLKPVHPSLSLGTVYRNLSILAEQGMIRKIESRDAADRFDGNMEPHSHVQCQECGHLEDVFLSYDRRLDEQAQQVTGFQIQEHTIVFSGLCQNCKGKHKSA
ncbi:MAG: transcriptional repressor [Oscillospiraceae bacterium]|nr:transcriptional repressor [Oscillospiraceae bacterium]